MNANLLKINQKRLNFQYATDIIIWFFYFGIMVGFVYMVTLTINKLPITPETITAGMVTIIAGIYFIRSTLYFCDRFPRRRWVVY